MTIAEKHSFFAPCPKGVESLLADELRRIGVPGVRPQRSGVLFAGSVASGLKVLMWTRLATRVLLRIAEVDASSADALHAGVMALPWEDHLRPGGTLAVDATGVNDALRNTQFTAVRVKDGVADRFRERFGRRPSVDTSAPDVRINVAIRAGKATIAIDLAGDSLHRRGYREPGVQVAAPMKETLAAAALEWAGWRQIAQEGRGFVDPMCGSGTLAIEAALMAGDVAPGLLRGEPAAARWLGFDAEAWARLTADAERRRDAGLAGLPVIVASDIDPTAVAIATRCVQRAGLEFLVNVERRSLSELQAPDDVAPGLVLTNPPWGERLSERSELAALYAEMARALSAGFAGWSLAVVSPDPDLARGLAMKSLRSDVLGSGKGQARVTLFSAIEAAGTSPVVSEPTPLDSTPAEKPVERREPPVGAEEFANRLAKMAKHYGKWARRAGVTCYRVYDADLPDFAVAVDLYQGAGSDEGKRWAHVAEYAAPAEIDAAKAAARLDAAVIVVGDVLGIPAADVFVKRRQRQRGTAQYERVSTESVRGVVSEGELLFEVNFTDYLDTGLFLDHRDTRAWLSELAEGKRFCNLFAYTGSATVHAAAGGATKTVTTDLSATYLEWAERNLALNGFVGEQHKFVQRDTAEFIERAKKRDDKFDLIFCDPPTFSNSKRMDGTWDVQRDHAELIIDIRDILARDGLIVFSTNRRSFEIDEKALRSVGLVVTDVTAQTIPKDFERRPNVHRCWEIRRK